MTRGNQRDKAREANLKKQAAQKKGNTMSDNKRAQAKDGAALIMREKQRLANERKAAEAAAGGGARK